jgi:hypothetical protein
MTTFTIDTENNITVHGSKKAARETGAGVFSTEEQFADLIGPDNKRLVEIFNSLPGVKPVTKFANRKVATERIWKAIQSLADGASAPSPTVQAEEPQAATPEVTPEVVTEAATEPSQATAAADIYTALPAEVSEPATAQVEPETPVASAATVATPGTQGANVAPAPAESGEKATPAKNTPKAKKSAKAPEAAGPREGSKTAHVVAMLQRNNGATLSEIMDKMGWQKHTVRGFMAGAMKKAGYAVQSFKSEGGERTYRINA